MNFSRDISKFFERLFVEHLEKGAITPHHFSEEDTTSYWSNPDSEAILSAMNSLQEESRLNDFFSSFKGNRYKLRIHGGQREVSIRRVKITFPSKEKKHDIEPPSPLMDKETLKKYIWPNAELSRENTSYVSSLWIDIGEEDLLVDTSNEDEEGNSYIYEDSSEWYRILDIPIQVGSNRCNLAKMRSYLFSGTREEKIRAKKFLEDVVLWEPFIPDGYFVIYGKMKKINVFDRLIMNTPYTVNVNISTDFGRRKFIPVRNRITEARSVSADRGFSWIKVMLANREDLVVEKDTHRDTFKFYSATLAIYIPDKFKYEINILDFVRAYTTICDDKDPETGVSDFISLVQKMSSNDRECMRILSLTRMEAGERDKASIVKMYRDILLGVQNISTDDLDLIDEELKMRLRNCIPHTDSTFSALCFLAIMIIELVLSTTTIPGTKERRKDVTDRKDFIYKRWETPGHLFRDYIRKLFKENESIFDKDTFTTRKTYYDLNSLAENSQQILTLMNSNAWGSPRIGSKSYKISREKQYDGIVDDVPKYNILSMIDSLRTVKISARGGPNTSSIRRVHTSQWGIQCPVNTPENANIGLNNSIAEGCLISDYLLSSEIQDLEDLIEELLDEDGTHILILDGNPKGYVQEDAYDQLKEARKEGSISRSIGIAIHSLWEKELPPGVPVIVVRSSHGRPLIPLIVAGKNYEGLEDEDFDSLLHEGVVEFVDAYEMCHNTVIAPWIHDIKNHTHAMIKPGHIISQISNCLSYLEHNPAARGTYASSHLKQAIGRPFLHPEERYDHDTIYMYNPEIPLCMTDTLRRLLSIPKEIAPSKGYSQRDIGFGRNVRIICMSFDGNNDDGVMMSESFVKSGLFDGEYYSITNSARSIQDHIAYDWIINEDTKTEILDDEKQGIPDPGFSGSIAIPYDEPYTLLCYADDLNPQEDIHELLPGEFYSIIGFQVPYIVTFRDNITGEEFEEEVIPGDSPLSIPGRSIVSKEKAEPFLLLGLEYISKDAYDRSKNTYTLNNARKRILTLEDAKEAYSPLDTTFLRVQGEKVQMKKCPIPKTLNTETKYLTRKGQPLYICPRKEIKRGDTAVRVMEREENVVFDPRGQKEKFDITYGVIDSIHQGISPRIKSAMPIQAKVGNKYAALYAQKSILAHIIPDDEMPKARWYNPVLQKEEEESFDIIFNPLSFPSRMTIGMEYEIFITGTVSYIFSLQNESGIPLGILYQTSREEFDKAFEKYSLENASSLLDELTDTTSFIYNNEEKYLKCRELRKKLGIPEDALYDVFFPDGEKVETPIFCGTIFYVALRHLVDNKRRARGYVGKRDPLTLQPVKGRRRNGGANTGTMETDAYKAHGASAMLHERLNKVSDGRTFLKCTNCGGLVSKNPSVHIYTCIDCDSTLSSDQVIRHDSVNSWHLFRNYAKPLGIEIKEEFE